MHIQIAIDVIYIMGHLYYSIQIYHVWEGYVFRVKHHDFTSKNHIFSNCGGRREHFGGISCEKSRFYAKKSYFFQF
jgi:hypothetical protein